MWGSNGISLGSQNDVMKKNSFKSLNKDNDKAEHLLIIQEKVEDETSLLVNLLNSYMESEYLFSAIYWKELKTLLIRAFYSGVISVCFLKLD